jgi:DNA-binding XRE family transcriptional regulator
MNANKKKALEAAGFRVGDASDFLGLTDEESRLVDLRIAVSRNVRILRKRGHLTQTQLAAKIDSSQSRVAKIESASSDVSLDLMFRGFFAAGGKLSDLMSKGDRKI